MTTLYLVGGLVLLIAGAELLVRGASRIAFRLGISPLVIGLTVVAFGTSSPELAVSLKAALSGQSSIALGNVVGSNVFNVLFILGAAALIAPLIVSQRLVRLDVPLMIGVSVLVVFLASDGSLDRVDGTVLVLLLAGYLGLLFRLAGAEPRDNISNRANERPTPWWSNTLMVFGGLALLTLGSRWLVDAAVSIALAIGVSELIVGLTIVAAGTSLPEVVTSIVASVKGERDIAVGNVVGSNLFNILGVLGGAAIAAPDGIDVSASVAGFDLPIMIVVAFACLPIFFTGGVISRWEGALLLGYYAAYTSYLVLAASHHDNLEAFSAVVLYFALPLTLVTLVAIALLEMKSRRRG